MAGRLGESDIWAARPDKGRQRTEIHTACYDEERHDGEHQNERESSDALKATALIPTLVTVANLAFGGRPPRKGQIEYKDAKSTNADKRAEQLKDGPDHAGIGRNAKHDVRVEREYKNSNDAAK